MVGWPIMPPFKDGQPNRAAETWALSSNPKSKHTESSVVSYASQSLRSTAMDEKKSKKSSKGQLQVEPAPAPEPLKHEKFALSDKFSCLKTNPKCCSKFFKIIFVVLAIITTLKAIGVIAISIMTAIATKVYDQEQSGRLVALIVVAVTAAVTVAITIYAVVAVFTKKNRPIHAAAIVLIVLALIQAIIAGTAIRVTNEDQIHLGRALTDSFRLAKEHNPRNVKMWAATQHNLNCCGMYGPEDYRPSNVPSYFPPDVPISCCPAYDPNRSDLVQERDREICKARKNFNDIGCKYLVLDMYVDSSSLALSVIIGLIILEVSI
ncbi:uncharacterized protein [Choristoneura fumiferana]|uniref:uncharacterized protein n=1 Tax=Choristoneura fumiferana TaxID=7141 RepID=UPI003D15830F